MPSLLVADRRKVYLAPGTRTLGFNTKFALLVSFATAGIRRGMSEYCSIVWVAICRTEVYDV